MSHDTFFFLVWLTGTVVSFPALWWLLPGWCSEVEAEETDPLQFFVSLTAATCWPLAVPLALLWWLAQWAVPARRRWWAARRKGGKE